ncbi:MAG: TrmH family RNA methyltransferase [Spirochaetales bacterium]|nr:TrmH family RNA methyltransferase [Spirochaetales bacterium]
MITIRKLQTLKPETLKRKTAVILQSFEQDLIAQRSVNEIYLSELVKIISEVFADDSRISSSSLDILSRIDEMSSEEMLRALNSLRHLILQFLGTEPADWDLSVDRSPSSKASVSSMGESCFEIFLDDIRSPFNVGSIFRTAEAFGVSKIYLSPDCPSPEHARARRSSMGTADLVDWEYISRDECFSRMRELDIPVFALELGGTSVTDFQFPERALAVIGSEELGISPEARAASGNSSGLLSIPVYGKKGSLNVSSAFAIMMHCWASFLF